MNIISVKELSKSYHQNKNKIPVLCNLYLNVARGSSVAVIGESGRGKTTLLYLLSGLDQADSGEIIVDGIDITELNDSDLTKFRMENFGFVFQHHFLLQDLTAFDNAILPLRVSNNLNENTIQNIEYLFEYFGLSNRTTHFPDELSGGEKQRIAVIRALANKPKILVADEPTGSLDKSNADRLGELLFELSEKEHITLILSTHNQQLAHQCNIVHKIDELEQAL